MKLTKSPILILSIFIIIALSMFFATGNSFLIFNFLYIGGFIAIGVFLFENNVDYARNVILLAIGSYLLIYLGIFNQENLLISGFWYYLFLGVFQASVIHFLIAKIAGPVIFGRGFCGYACWLAMIFDLLPYKRPKGDRKPYGYIRYLLFILILSGMSILFVYGFTNNELLLEMFIIGNILYYIIGIVLAIIFKDNRAFCKYICPITVFLKFFSYFSLLRIKCNNHKCDSCNKCLKVCPMNVDMLNDSRKRKNGTECILCGECVRSCKQDALNFIFK